MASDLGITTELVQEQLKQAKEKLEQAGLEEEEIKKILERATNDKEALKKLLAGEASTKEPTPAEAADLSRTLTELKEYDAINIVLAGMQGIYLAQKLGAGLEGKNLENHYAASIADMLQANGYVNTIIGSNNPLLKQIPGVEVQISGKDQEKIKYLREYGKNFLANIDKLGTQEFIDNAKQGLKKINNTETAGLLKRVLEKRHKGAKETIKQMSGLEALLGHRLSDAASKESAIFKQMGMPTQGFDLISSINNVKNDKYGSQLYSLINIPYEGDAE